jgi:hypothetical protein
VEEGELGRSNPLHRFRKYPGMEAGIRVVMRLMCLVVMVGCIESEPEPMPDAGVERTADACVREVTGGCCDLLPDEDAVRECITADMEPGTCGVMACWAADCTLTKVNFCAD